MSTEINPVIDTDDPDLKAILDRIQGKPLVPAVYARIKQQGAEITEDIRKQQGMIDLAVSLIRETREQCD